MQEVVKAGVCGAPRLAALKLLSCQHGKKKSTPPLDFELEKEALQLEVGIILVVRLYGSAERNGTDPVDNTGT